jgi:hypothetical protein
MRRIGLTLVLLGALTLAIEGFAFPRGGSSESTNSRAVAAESIAPVPVSPAVSGIAVTTGLLIIISGTRRGLSRRRPAWPAAKLRH